MRNERFGREMMIYASFVARSIGPLIENPDCYTAKRPVVLRVAGDVPSLTKNRQSYALIRMSEVAIYAKKKRNVSRYKIVAPYFSENVS